MHEASVAASILEILRARLALKAPEAMALYVTVRIGEFRAVDPDSLSFAFDSLKKDYAGCRNCRLLVEPVKAMAVCAGEGHYYHASSQSAFACRECGAGIRQLLAGGELDITGYTVQSSESELEHNNA